MPNKTKKIQKSISSKTNKLPTLQECGGFTYHYPWNKSKYKKACEDKKCFFNYRTFGILGSYCEDAITVTNRNLSLENLDNIKNLCKLSIKQLKDILYRSNKADDKYYQHCLNLYVKKRNTGLEKYVVNCEEQYIISLEDKLIDLFVKHAKEAGLKNIKEVKQIKYHRFLYRRNCYYSKLGNVPNRYKMCTWNDIKSILDSCYIPKYSIFYEQARLHFEIYSCNSPYYHILEMPKNKEGNIPCETDCECRGTRICINNKCENDINAPILNPVNPIIIKPEILPGGNWKNTAKDIYVDKNILKAKLKRRDGSYVYDKVIFKPNDTFSNIDGKFKLDYIKKLPCGNWKETAKDIEIKDGVLSALLEDKKGNYIHDYIIYNKDICLNNNNGKFEVIIC